MSAQRVQQLESSHVSTADSVNIYIPTRKMCSFPHNNSIQLHSFLNKFQTVAISRSREVHQSWISTILSFVQSTLDSLRILLSYQPDLVITFMI